jgi:hypothetical protein
VLLGLWGLAVLACFLGFALRPPAGGHRDVAQQALDLVRVAATVALAIVLVLGPGLALRVCHRPRHLALGFVPLPGLGLLVVTGCVAWALSKEIHPRVVCTVLLAPVFVWLLVCIVRVGPEEVLTPEERRVLLIVAAVLGIAVGRSVWSLGPLGELYAGTNFRTLEVGDRSDSRVPFGVVQLVAHGHSPFGSLARGYFQGYSFSYRGPLSGIASTPVVLLSGGRPPIGAASPWSPVDSQGFMSYRLAMMTFASTAFLSLWTLTRSLGGERAARLALLLAATTPFLVHETWFTWPKLLAASLVLLAAVTLIHGRFLEAGLLVGVGYLVHPLALLSVPALGLLALWPLAGASVRRPRVEATLLMLGAVAVCLIGWRLANGSHYTQSGFLDYLTQAGTANTLHATLIRALGGHPPPVTPSDWLSDRLVSVGNTLVPLRLFLFSAQDQGVNSASQACFPFCSGGSPGIVHFFFQYWTGVPFGMAIVFFPLLLQSVWRAARRWMWAVTATVIVPFVVFAVYWGGASTGLLREGLHVWVFTLLVVVALEQQRERFAWLRKAPLRALLALRSAEVLLVAMLPTLVTRHRLYQRQFRLSDIVAVAVMVALSGWLGILVWREHAPESPPG